MTGLVYDTGALIAAERRERAIWALHDEVIARGATPIVPVVVLAQAWRGGPQALLSRLLGGCHVVPIEEDAGRAAGRVCAATGTSDIVDALVVVLALANRAAVVTSDPGDLGRLADAVGRSVPLHAI